MIEAAPVYQPQSYYVFKPKILVKGEVYGPVDLRDIHNADRLLYDYYPIEDYEFWTPERLQECTHVVLWPEGSVSSPYTLQRAVEFAATLQGSQVFRLNPILYF